MRLPAIIEALASDNGRAGKQPLVESDAENETGETVFLDVATDQKRP